jgi:hypothetical protein
MTSENNPLLVPMHCGSVTVLLTCWDTSDTAQFLYVIRGIIESS